MIDCLESTSVPMTTNNSPSPLRCCSRRTWIASNLSLHHLWLCLRSLLVTEFLDLDLGLVILLILILLAVEVDEYCDSDYYYYCFGM